MATSAYTRPSLRIEQQFVPLPGGNALPLYGCMIGPHYGLHRYGVTAEEALLGAYNKTSGNTFTAWPDKDVNSNVDVSSAALWMRSATMQYQQFTQLADTNVGLLSNGGSRIRSGGSTPYVFKTANGSARSSVYGTRDVQLGDYINVTNGSIVKETVVLGFEADQVAAVTGASAAASSNVTSTTLSNVLTAHFGTLTGTFTCDASGYDGLADGYPSETYTVQVLSTDGTLANTFVKISSGSGTDDVASQQVSASGVDTPCGTRGATFNLTRVGGTVLGSDWFLVTVAQDFTAVIPASSGTYTGLRASTYIIKITQGGTIDTDILKFKVTTTNGYDMSPEITVSAAGVYVVGNYGVAVTFVSGDQYVTGSQYTIAVTAAGDGPIRTLILGAAMTGMLVTDNLVITLGLTDSFKLDISQWTASTASILVAANATHVAAYLGAEQPFYILAGAMYMDYRELLLTGINVVNALSDPLTVEPTEGPIVEANPIAMMMYAALTGSVGTQCYYIKTGGETFADYQAALDVLTNTFQVWGLVPWNSDQDIVDLCQAHVDAMSAPDVAFFRKVYKGVDLKRYIALYVADSTGGELLATISGSVLTCANAEFGVAGIRPGDSIQINYQADNLGGVTFDTYTVLSVGSATTLNLTTAPGDITVPVKMEVWRNQTLPEYAAAIAASSHSWDDRRVTSIWCEPITLLGQADLPKAVAAALIAGIRSASAPHQPLTNFDLTSYIDLVPVNNFGASLLDVMAAAGTWLIVKDVEGNIYTRHQLTTDMSDARTREDSITSNFDHVTRDFKNSCKDLWGQGNATQEMLDLIRSRVYAKKSEIQSRSYPQTLGSQITDLSIVSLYIDPVLIDHVWCILDIQLPEPMNNLTLQFKLIGGAVTSSSSASPV